MNFLKIVFVKTKNFWNKCKLIQKIIFFGIILLGIIGILNLILVSSPSDMVPVINVPIMDVDALDRIVFRINKEGHKVMVNSKGIILVENETTARQMRTIIIREDLIPIEKDYSDSIDDKEEKIQTYFKKNSHYFGIFLIIIGICLLVYTLFTIMYGEKIGKILTSIVFILLGVIFLLPIFNYFKV
jgi:flagellar biosynthesis/type III secretory pathway M-ring protein FliF/YscJ